ncbi:MAG: 5-formyltetrahydrofolate cyclo-ligase [Hymenobacter sp.]|nr:5-formyltetrahydrofolate cyclo-ligase [Hymenobacter sp.]
MRKADLRRAALARRRALPPAELTRRSYSLCRKLFYNFPVTEWRWLHLFLPAARQHEPDTWEIIRWIWGEEMSVRLAVPVVQPDDMTLRHYHLTADTQLADNRWGIPEPVGAVEVVPPQLDAVLVPLLAFDEAGHRVGYGKGFYDRFLAGCRPDAQRIGLSLEPPVARIADAWAGDVRLHACVTPDGVWRFGE